MRRAPLAAVLVALAAGCGGSKVSAPTTTTAPGHGPVVHLPVAAVRFAEYSAPPLATVSAAYAGRATPHSLDHVVIPASLLQELKDVPALSTALEQNGFAVVPSNSILFHNEYDGNTYGGWAVYVTTDAAYNAWHLAFDKVLRDLEQNVLLPKLERLVGDQLRLSRRQARDLRGTPLATDAVRAAEVYEVAAAELDLPVTLDPTAAREKALIDEHTDAQGTSPILGTKVDYSLFTPRGHYTLTPKLTRFFVGMSVLSQLGFCLPGTRDCPGIQPARIGILASDGLASYTDDAKLWHELYDPTSFLVGAADDYTPEEVADAANAVLPRGLTANTLTGDRVEAIVKRLESTRPVQIDPERASIRLMGTRAVTDEIVLDQLLYPHVGTEDKPRLTPSALDVASVLGSQFAHTAMDGEGAGTYAHYDSQVQLLQRSIAARPADDWGSTVYDAWLAALQPVFAPHGDAFPDYMRGDTWAAKDLQSGLGSYTELKHDTILFAKQAQAEAGGETPPPPPPRNWVEPEPAAFGRLAAVADLMEQGLATRNLLTPDATSLLAAEVDLFRFLGRIAGDELAGKPIDSVDDLRLRRIGDELSAIWWRTTQGPRLGPTFNPDQAALVADIASGPKGVAEIAIGRVDSLYVLVPTDDGRFELARGGVYSWYGFESPPGTRLTDQEWRATLDAGKAPARPAWESAFLVSCPKKQTACSPSYAPG